MTHGAPQGATLGPLTFNFFMHPLAQMMENKQNMLINIIITTTHSFT